MFVGYEGGGRTAAVLCSVVQACRELKSDSRQYLGDALIWINQARSGKLAQLRGKDVAAE